MKPRVYVETSVLSYLTTLLRSGEVMTPDPIIDEIRAFRDEIAREHDYDVGAIFEAFRKMERESGREHVSFPPRRVAVVEMATDSAAAKGRREVG